MNNENRWRQRFQNFSHAYALFVEIIEDHDVQQLSDLEKEGFIQRFEYTFELAWKTLKDYLEDSGFEVKSPKETIRQAFHNEYITDGEVWMQALEARNRTSHTYNKEVLNNTVDFLVNDFYPTLRDMYFYFEKEAKQ